MAGGENIIYDDDLVFFPGENYFPQMIQGSWRDQGGRYRLDFKDSTLEIYEDANLILKEDIVLEYGSISLKDKRMLFYPE